MVTPEAGPTVYNMVMVYLQRPAQVFLSRSQVEARIGLRPGGLTSAKLPPPDAIIGPVNKDGSLSRGTTRGWLPETIDYWKRARPGQGFRTDVRPPPAGGWPTRPQIRRSDRPKD